jgi:hypothetical protein
MDCSFFAESCAEAVSSVATLITGSGTLGLAVVTYKLQVEAEKREKLADEREARSEQREAERRGVEHQDELRLQQERLELRLKHLLHNGGRNTYIIPQVVIQFAAENPNLSKLQVIGMYAKLHSENFKSAHTTTYMLLIKTASLDGGWPSPQEWAERI